MCGAVCHPVCLHPSALLCLALPALLTMSLICHSLCRHAASLPFGSHRSLQRRMQRRDKLPLAAKTARSRRHDLSKSQTMFHVKKKSKCRSRGRCFALSPKPELQPKPKLDCPEIRILSSGSRAHHVGSFYTHIQYRYRYNTDANANTKY